MKITEFPLIRVRVRGRPLGRPVVRTGEPCTRTVHYVVLLRRCVHALTPESTLRRTLLRKRKRKRTKPNQSPEKETPKNHHGESFHRKKDADVLS